MNLLLQKIADIRDLKTRIVVLTLFYFSLIFLASHFAAELAIHLEHYPPKSLTAPEWQSFLYALWYCPFLIPFFLLPPKSFSKNSAKIDVYYLAIAILTASFTYAFVTSFEPKMIRWARRENNPVQEWLQNREATFLNDVGEDKKNSSEVRDLTQDPRTIDKLIEAMQFGPDAQMLAQEKEDASHGYDIFLQLQEAEHAQNASSSDPVETRDAFIKENIALYTNTYRLHAIEGLASFQDKRALDALKDFSVSGQPESLRLFALSKIQPQVR